MFEEKNGSDTVMASHLGFGIYIPIFFKQYSDAFKKILEKVNYFNYNI